MSDNKLQDQGERFYRSQGYMGETVFQDERPTFWLNQHEVSARRGQARAKDMASARPRSNSSDVGV